MSKYAKMDGLVEFVYALREENTPWDKEGGIVTQVKAKYPAYTTNSAIPLRNLYNAHKAKLDSGEAIRPTKGAIRKARTAGLGWANIAGRAGITIAKAKKLAGADFEYATGRVYVDQDGKVSTHKTEWVRDEDGDVVAATPETTEDATPVVEDAPTSAPEEVVAA